MSRKIMNAYILLSLTPPYQRTPNEHNLFSLKKCRILFVQSSYNAFLGIERIFLRTLQTSLAFRSYPDWLRSYSSKDLRPSDQPVVQHQPVVLIKKTISSVLGLEPGNLWTGVRRYSLFTTFKQHDLLAMHALSRYRPESNGKLLHWIA